MGFIDDVIIDGAKLDADISGRIGSVKSIRTMSGASTIEMQVIDEDHRIRETGLLTRRGKAPKKTDFEQSAWGRFGQVRLTINGRFYRLAGYSKEQGSDVLLLTWEDEIATLMRGKQGPRKASRADMSRLDFVVHGARRVRSYRINIRAPEADEKQPIRGDSPRARAKQRERGLAKRERVTVKGVKATREQRRNLETILAVADEEKAGELATVAMLCAAIGESGVLAVPNAAGSNYHGVFQGSKDVFKIDDTEGMAKCFLRGGKGFQQGGAIKLATENPDITPGDIATRVEASGEDPGFYDAWAEEAHAILDAYGGVGRVVVDRHRYEFEVAGPDRKTREPAENEWDASGRLLEEVRFRRFATENTLWLVSDEWLFGREPVWYLEENEHIQIGVNAHIGMPVADVEVKVRKPIWTGRPGRVSVISDSEGPIAGRWLTESIIEELNVSGGVTEADLIVRRPASTLAEPEAEKTPRLLTESPAEAGSVRAAIVEMAKEALSRKDNYRYGQVRPMPRSLFFTGTRPAPRTGAPIPLSGKIVTDCSGFVTLVYKAAGAPDPNGRDYDGQGWTGTLKANGKRTGDPQPGDLAFYGSPEDVKVYIGDGEVIGFGGNPIKRYKVHDRWDFQEYRTYDLGG